MSVPPAGDLLAPPGRDWPGIPDDPGVELAVVTRSGFVESRHRGHAVVTDPDGAAVLSLGRPEGTFEPRSSLKPLQATGCLLAGAELSGAALAIAAGSHRGHPDHLDLVASVLADHGFDESDLRCPDALPGEPWALEEYLRAGHRPRPLAMNCSGKHAAMLAACRAAGWDPTTYPDPDHPLQQQVRSVVAQVTGVEVPSVGTDGCGAPLFTTTLVGLARSIGKGARAAALEATDDASAGGRAFRSLGRVARAMRQHPWAVSGVGSEDTIVMQELDGVVAKGGAEGVLALGTADGYGIALKVADGSDRAKMPVGLALARVAGIDDAGLAASLATRTLGGGQPVGRVHATVELDA